MISIRFHFYGTHEKTTLLSAITPETFSLIKLVRKKHRNLTKKLGIGQGLNVRINVKRHFQKDKSLHNKDLILVEAGGFRPSA